MALILTLFLALLSAASLEAASCEELARITLDHVTVVTGQSVKAGGFPIPAEAHTAPPEFFTAFDRLPPFCRVQALARPTADSNIGIEVWLPASGWNGRYLGVGNGGYGGSINVFRLGEALNAGYAVSSTDTGHRGGARDEGWAKGHREKQIDFDYRAVHETAVTANALIRAFYGSAPHRSYFASCSNGGRQGLMEAERYPVHYDRIFAGAPALDLGFTAYVTGDFTAFAKRGGKIIIYHGGNDAPAPSIALFEKVSHREQFLQLYVIPGMEHCGSGPEPDDIGQWIRPKADARHSLFVALQEWVERGQPPRSVIATRFVRDGDATSGIASERLLYPYVRDPHGNSLRSVHGDG